MYEKEDPGVHWPGLSVEEKLCILGRKNMWEYNSVVGEENSHKTSGKLKQVKNQMVSRRVATTGTRTINAGK